MAHCGASAMLPQVSQKRTLALTARRADGGRVGGEHVEGHALGGLGADTGQLAEFVDEVLDGAFVDGGHVSVLPESR